ncbi:MAG: hypothetical protein ACPKM0_02730, partial [Pleomorphochaeta sp.]
AFPWILDTARSCDTLDEFLQSINEITDEENLDENLAFDLDNFNDTWLSNKDSKRAFAAKIYEFSRVVTPQQADRVFINSTSDKYDLINLAIELNTPYMDVENNKVVIKQPVFKGVSPIVLSINEDSTKKQVSQALNQIKKNTKAYRQALIVKQQAEQRIKMLHGDNDISDISDRLAYSEMFLNDVDIEEELSTYSGFKNIKVDENIKQKNLTNIELTEEYIEKQIQELDIKDKELSAAKKEVNSLEKEVEKLKASKVDNKETKKELTSVNNALKRALKTIEVLNEKEVNRKARIVRNDLIKNIKTRSKFNSDIHDAKYKESIDWVHHIFDRENREDTSLNIPFSDDFNRPGNEPLYIPRMLMEYIPKDFILTRDNRVSRWNVEDLEKLELVLRNLLDDSKASLFNKKEIERQRREAINNAYFTQMYGRQAERFDENLGYASAINRDIRVNVENAPENIFFHGKEGKMKRAYNVFTGAFGHIQRISRELDGNKEGVLYNHFTRDLQGNFSSYYLHKQQRIEVLDKYMQDHDININYMAEKIYKYNPSKNIEIDLTREQCLGVYIYSLNKFGLPKLMSAGGNKLSNNDILNIQAKLSNKDIMFAHKLIELIGRGDASERLENTLYHVYNKIIKKEKNYFPLAADSIEPKEDKSSKTKVIGAKRTLQSWVDNGMMKDRVDAIYSLDLNVISTFKSQVDAQERVIAFSRWVKDSNYLLADNASVGQILSNLYGESRQKNLQDFVNRVAKISEQISKIEKMANLALSNFSASRITYSVSATMHQLASLGASVRGDIDTDILVACLIDPHVMNRKSEMETLAPEMKNRVFNLEVSRFRNLEHTNKTTRGVSKAVDAGMKGSELIDAFVTTKLWWGVYKTQIRKGQTEQEAIFRASQFIAETQSSSNEMDLSDVQAGKSHFLRTLARFKNDNFQRWNQLFFDLPYFMKTKQYSKVMGTLFSNVLSAGIFVATTGALMKAAGDDEDKYKSLVKSFIDSVIRQLIGDTIPLVGDDVVEAFDTYRFGSSMAWQPALNAVGTVWQEFKDEDDDTEALKKKGFNMFSETLGLLYGLPTTQSQRAYRAIKEKDLLRLLGGYWSQ